MWTGLLLHILIYNSLYFVFIWFYIIFKKFFFKNKLFSLFFFFLPRDSFPFDQQFNILMRFIVDQTQTPNLKVGNDLSLQFSL